jgi:drug/metabolite transporter (DMT)-like permease
MSARSSETPLLVGGTLAVLSAVLFGVSTLFVQRFGQHSAPFTTAGILYAGGGLASLLGAYRTGSEAPVRREHLPRLLAVALFGAVAAPVALAWGLHRTGAATASLMLASEAFFTVVMARVLFREPIGLRVAAALGAMGLGAGCLLAGSALSGANLGSLAVLAASLAWATDNTLTRPLADLDPRRVVVWKCGMGAALSVAIAMVLREPLPPAADIAGLAVTGGAGYGVSLGLYLRAQRRIGAGRTGSVFAAAPFIGAIAAWLAGDRSLGWNAVVAGLFFALGAYLHLTERHRHAHAHAPIDHEHRHRHDDGHHLHAHDPPVLGEHSHAHSHAATEHSHPHGPDLHHQHDHE